MIITPLCQKKSYVFREYFMIAGICHSVLKVHLTFVPFMNYYYLTLYWTIVQNTDSQKYFLDILIPQSQSLKWSIFPRTMFYERLRRTIIYRLKTGHAVLKSFHLKKYSTIHIIEERTDWLLSSDCQINPSIVLWRWIDWTVLYAVVGSDRSKERWTWGVQMINVF